METKRLKRIKPQFVPRRPLWRRKLSLPPRPQNPDEEVTALLAQFVRASRFRHPAISRRAVGPLSIILSVILTCTMLSVVQVPASWSITLWCLVQVLIMVSLRYWTASDRLLALSYQLSGCDDLRAIPALTRALSWPEARARVAAVQALTRLLPRLQAIDTGLLDTPTRCRLHRHLARPKTQCRQGLAVAILKALESVGDGRDLQSVTALVRRPARNMAERRIQHAALVCLPYLTTHIEQSQARLSPLPLAEPVVGTSVAACPTLVPKDDTQEILLPLGTAKNS